VQLRVDGATTAWPSYVDLESAARALLAGQARSVELRASPNAALVALRTPEGRILLEGAMQRGRKAPVYISCLSPSLVQSELDEAFALFHDGRLEELDRRFCWASTRPQRVRDDRRLGWGLIMWLILSQLFPLIDVLFRTKRR
jgi:hypothetical protein